MFRIPRYNLYIAKHIVIAMLVITLSLTSIVWLTQALRFIDFIVNRGVSIGTFVSLTGLLIPNLLFFLLPIALFISVIFTYNRLMNDSEMVVMSGAGLSPWQLASPAIWISVLGMIACYVLALYIMPLSNRQFRDMQVYLRDNYASLLLQEEVFSTPVDGLTVFIRERTAEGNLKGILVHDNRDEKAPVTMMAELGKLVQSGGEPQFYLYKGNRQERRNGKLSILNFESYVLDLSFYTAAKQARERDPSELFIGDLFRYQSTNSIETAERRATAHQRLTWPLLTLGLPVLGLGILLMGRFNRRGHWKRVAIASAVIAISTLVVAMLGNLITQHSHLTPVIYIMALATIVGGALGISVASAIMPPPPIFPHMPNAHISTAPRRNTPPQVEP